MYGTGAKLYEIVQSEMCTIIDAKVGIWYTVYGTGMKMVRTVHQKGAIKMTVKASIQNNLNNVSGGAREKQISDHWR